MQGQFILMTFLSHRMIWLGRYLALFLIQMLKLVDVCLEHDLDALYWDLHFHPSETSGGQLVALEGFFQCWASSFGTQ